jgi:hypothetical protein
MPRPGSWILSMATVLERRTERCFSKGSCCAIQVPRDDPAALVFISRGVDEVFRQHSPVASVAAPAAAPCVCLDNVIPPQLVSALQHALRPEAPFWSEHQLRGGPLSSPLRRLAQTTITTDMGTAVSTSRTGMTSRPPMAHLW